MLRKSRFEDPAHPTPATFNTFVIWNQIKDYPTLKIYDIEYYDDVESTWKATVPDMFKLLGNGATLEYNFYYFDRQYTTTKVRFKLWSILGGINGIGKTEIYEMGFGTIEAE